MEMFKQNTSRCKLSQNFIIFILLICFAILGATLVYAASVAMSGKAKVTNTSAYLDFTNYSSTVVVDSATGRLSGYVWLEDLGWVAFGTTDNSEGPVMMDTVTGAVTGKGKVLDAGAYLDFTNYGSNVTVELETGVFSGFVWSEDVGWIDFSDIGVTAGSPLVTATPTPAVSSDTTPPKRDYTVIDPNSGVEYTKIFQPTSLGNLTVVGDTHYPLFCFARGYDDDSGVARYTILVDGADYLNNIPYNQPPVGDNGDTRKDGESVIKEDPTRVLIYHLYDDVSKQQEVCAYGKGDDKNLNTGVHTWSVKATDNAGNSTNTETRRFLIMTNQGTQGSAVQSIWFPLTLSQVGNRTKLTGYDSYTTSLYSSLTKPISFTDSTPILYGIAPVGSEVVLTLTKDQVTPTGDTERIQVLTQATTANQSSEWGINLTTALTKGAYYITIQASDASDHFAILKDIPVKLMTNPETNRSVLGIETESAEIASQSAVIVIDEPTATPTLVHSPTSSFNVNANPVVSPTTKPFCIWKWCW